MLTEPRSNDNLVGMSTPSGKILVYNFASSVKETRPLWKSWGGQKKKKKKELRLEHLAMSKKRCTQKKDDRDFPGGPLAKTWCSQCRAPSFDP